MNAVKYMFFNGREHLSFVLIETHFTRENVARRVLSGTSCTYFSFVVVLL